MSEMKNMPAVLYKEHHKISPWVSLTSKQIRFSPYSLPQTYHSLAIANYVSILAIVDGRIPLVRQYRPALEQITIELPGGLVEADSYPELSARKELEEEVGLVVPSKLELVGCFIPDTGRLENRIWGYIIQDESTPKQGWEEEPNVERVWVSPQELKEMIRGEQFNHALHLAIILRAIINGQFSW